MTTTTANALPAIPLQDLSKGLLKADFYAYEEILSDDQRATIDRLREFFATRVVPIVDDHWARAEFPHHLIPEFAGLGLVDWADPDSSAEEPNNLMNGITAMELAHAD